MSELNRSHTTTRGLNVLYWQLFANVCTTIHCVPGMWVCVSLPVAMNSCCRPQFTAARIEALQCSCFRLRSTVECTGTIVDRRGVTRDGEIKLHTERTCPLPCYRCMYCSTDTYGRWEDGWVGGWLWGVGGCAYGLVDEWWGGWMLLVCTTDRRETFLR